MQLWSLRQLTGVLKAPEAFAEEESETKPEDITDIAYDKQTLCAGKPLLTDDTWFAVESLIGSMKLLNSVSK